MTRFCTQFYTVPISVHFFQRMLEVGTFQTLIMRDGNATLSRETHSVSCLHHETSPLTVCIFVLYQRFRLLSRYFQLMQHWCPKEVEDWLISTDDTCALVDSVIAATWPTAKHVRILIVGVGYTKLAVALRTKSQRYVPIVSDVDADALRYQKLLIKSSGLQEGPLISPGRLRL